MRAPRLRVAAVLSSFLATQAAAEGLFRVEVDRPGPRESTADFHLIEVKGFAGEARNHGHDLVIALDVSESTVGDSGVDLDGDGPDGRTDPDFLAWLEEQQGVSEGLLQSLRAGQDFEDSILAAELLATEALIDRLEPQRFRVGLVAFSDQARVLAPVGSSPAELREALRGLRRSFPRELRGTNFAAGIATANLALVPDLSSRPAERERSIVFLSDGAPTLPVYRDRPREFALESSVVAGLAGIRLFAFAIGPEGAEALDVLGEMASVTGGRVEHIERPGDTVSRLRHLDLVDLAELTIRNATTGTQARAVRTFPDGSFDGFVELAPGLNRIQVSARSQNGSRHAAERLVTLRAARMPEPETANVLEELKRRTAEMRLWADIEHHRRALVSVQRIVEVEPLAPTASAGDPATFPRD